MENSLVEVQIVLFVMTYSSFYQLLYVVVYEVQSISCYLKDMLVTKEDELQRKRMFYHTRINSNFDNHT